MMGTESSVGKKRTILFIVLVSLAVLFLVAVWHRDLKENLFKTASRSQVGKTEPLQVAKLAKAPSPVVIRKKIHLPPEGKLQKEKSTPTVIVINAGPSDLERKDAEISPQVTDNQDVNIDKKPDQETTTEAVSRETSSQKLLAQSTTTGTLSASQSENDTTQNSKTVEQKRDTVEKQEKIKPTDAEHSSGDRETPKASEPSEKIPPHPYSIMLSSCRLPESAEAVISESKKMGLSPYTVKVKIRDDEEWYRIFAGYYKTQGEALKVKQQYALKNSIIKKTPYTNLVGIFPTESEALKELAPLEKLGYSPYVVKSADNTYRVVVGAFVTRNAAEQKKLELQSKGVDNIVIQR